MGAGECLYDTTTNSSKHPCRDTHSIPEARDAHWDAKRPSSHTHSGLRAFACRPLCHTHNGTHTQHTPRTLGHTYPPLYLKTQTHSWGWLLDPLFSPARPACSSSAMAVLTSAHVCTHARQCTYTHVHSPTYTHTPVGAHTRPSHHHTFIRGPGSNTLNPSPPPPPPPSHWQSFAPRKRCRTLTHVPLDWGGEGRGSSIECSGTLFLGATQSHQLLTLPLPCYVTLRVTWPLRASICSYVKWGVRGGRFY